MLNTLLPFIIDGEVIIHQNGRLKIMGNYPTGTRSFVLGLTLSNYKRILNANRMLKHFAYKEILSSSAA